MTRHHLIPQHLMIGAGSTVEQRVARAVEAGRGKEFIGYLARDIKHDRNVVALCRLHHDAIERGVLRSELRANLRPSEILHVDTIAGRDWLDRHYPPKGEPCSG